MTLSVPTLDLDRVQHLTLHDVPWDFYEHLLAVIGNGRTRVTYIDGDIEIMSPLPKHDTWGWRINRLLILMATEREIVLEGLGSTTFRNRVKKLGLEPDECYYVHDIEAIRQLDRAWDAAIDPPPDLAIEVDVTRRSIEREPIYAGLGVAELWRFDGKRITVRLLDGGTYRTAERSAVFPFLPMDEFCAYVHRLGQEPQLTVLKEFRRWVCAL